MNLDFYLGIPYVSKGRSVLGCDCWGLVQLVLAREFGLVVPSYLEAYTNSEDDTVSFAIAQAMPAWREIPIEQADAGDVLVLQVLGLPVHCGVAISRGVMLHSMKRRGVGREDYRHGFWSRRIEGVYRWPS